MTASRNPFPGPKPYGQEDRPCFFGRKPAIDALCSQILVERCVTLYGPSGCGKSSLLGAGVLPQLEEERDVRTVVIRGWPDDASPLEGLLQEMSSVLRVGQTPSEERLSVDGPRTRVERIVRRAMQRSSRPILLYLDQMEQLLFPWRPRHEATEALFDAVEAIADLPVLGLHLVLGLREDFLGLLRARLRDRPRLLDAGFRLPRLTVADMAEIALAAAATGDPPQDWALEEVLPVLLDVPAGGQAKAQGSEVEAVLAQIVCRTQWDSWAAVPRAERPPATSAEAALRSYVDSTLGALGPFEEAAREFLEDELIDPAGGRRLLTASQAHEALQEHGLSGKDERDDLLERIEGASILRHHEHQSVIYFELGHDLLARHLVQRRRDREAENEKLAREKAARAEAEERQKEAEAKLREAQEEGEKQRRAAEQRRQRWRRQAVAALALALVAAVVALLALRLQKQSQEQAIVAGVMVQQSLGGDPAIALQVLLPLSPDADRYLDLAQSAVEDPPPIVTLKGHQDKVMGAEWTPDGQRVLTFSKDTTARLWSADGKGDPTVLSGHDAGILAAEISLDGSMAATASSDKTAIVWDLRTGEPIQRVAHVNTVNVARFSPDSRLLATASNDGTAAVWRVGEPDPPIVLAGHLGPVRGLAWSPNGQSLASVSDDGTLLSWSASDWTSRVFCCHPVGIDRKKSTLNPEAGIMEVSFSADGRRMLTTSQLPAGSIGKALIRVWSADGETAPLDFGLAQRTYVARLGPAGDLLAAAFADRVVRVWSTEHPEQQPTELRGHLAEVRDLAWSPDGQYVATASNDRTSRVFRTTDGRTPVVLRGHRSRVNTVRFSPSGDRVLTASNDGTARVWRTVEWNTLALSPRPVYGRRHSAAVSPDGLRAAFATQQAAHVYVVPVGAPAAALTLEAPTVVSTVRWSRDSKRLATTANVDPWTATIWRLEQARPAEKRGLRPAGAALHHADPGAAVELRGHEAPVYGTDFSPDGARVATASRDGTARIWDASTGKLLATFLHSGASLGIPEKTAEVWGVAWSPDGRRLATACQERVAVVWDVERPVRPLEVFRDHTEAVEWVAWSPDGRRVVTASYDHTVRIRNADGSGKAIVLPHDSGVISAVFDAAQTRLLSVSLDDRTARVWSLSGLWAGAAPGEPQMLRHEDALSAGSFAPDGKTALVVSDRSVRAWELDAEALRRRLLELNADCLEPKERQKHLEESERAAQVGYEECERRYGRTPRGRAGVTGRL